MNNSKQYTIQQLSEKLDIPRPTLRFWEKEFEGFLVPLRTPGGQRRYAEEHISVIESIKNFRDMGKSISEIKKHINNSSKDNLPDPITMDIDVLSEKITTAVKAEITKFFRSKELV